MGSQERSRRVIRGVPAGLQAPKQFLGAAGVQEELAGEPVRLLAERAGVILDGGQELLGQGITAQIEGHLGAGQLGVGGGWGVVGDPSQGFDGLFGLAQRGFADAEPVIDLAGTRA